MFRENINRICREKNTYLTTVIKNCGISTSKATAINKGSIPNEKTLIALSNVLNCSVMDFFNDGEDLPYNKEKPHLNEDEEDIVRIYRMLSRRDKHEFMTMVYDFENRKELEGDNDLSAIG